MAQLHGFTSGLAPAETKALERLYRRRVPPERLTTQELTRSLCEISRTTGRQVGLFIDRSGSVTHVIVGDAHRLELPDVGRLRAAQGRLRGLRLLHTHLRNEPLTRDDLVDLTKLRLDLVAAICLLHTGQPGAVYYAYNTPLSESVVQSAGALAGNEQGAPPAPYRNIGPIPYGHLDLNPAALIAGLEAEFARVARARTVVAKDGRAILVHVASKRDAARAEASMAELAELARTAGVEVAEQVTQVRERVDPKFVLGRGKLEDVVVLAMQHDVEVLIFDRNITPAQSAAIAAMTDLKVLDRSQLILDIFAQRAESRDGKLQVELAQMKYLLPRLGARDDALSRLTGGIGGRGPGETKLEVGKRRAQERITRISRELKKFGKQREQRRARRHRRDVPNVAIVGYTNAGKSTILNRLTESATLTEDKLFATLDTRSRRLRFPREREIVLTDTVGFIRDLPEDLFAAFRSTFEEAQDADLLLHVIDVSSEATSTHIASTEKLLMRLGLEQIPTLRVYNKVDLLSTEQRALRANEAGSVLVSALHRGTLRPLLDEIETRLFPAGFPDRLDGSAVDTLHVEVPANLEEEGDNPPT